jgi:poly(hydroxyalkanoate) granule-associated protein
MTQCVIRSIIGGEIMPEKKTVVPEDIPPEEEESGLTESLRRVLLASVGAVALTLDEIEHFVDKLVERGEIAEHDAKKLVKELSEKRKKKTGEAEELTTKRLHELLDRMDIPTKADISALSDKISTLGKKVDELKKAEEAKKT